MLVVPSSTLECNAVNDMTECVIVVCTLIAYRSTIVSLDVNRAVGILNVECIFGNSKCFVQVSLFY